MVADNTNPTDVRHRGVNWDVTTRHGKTLAHWESVHTALLMDIREELQTLNKVFACHNATAIPDLLREIAGNTKPKRKK